jgi:1-phosphatidylinositol-4-phosphate 5-kinase
MLVRFYGLFKIVFAGSTVVFLTLMNNVLPDQHHPVHHLYDLKGTTEARFVTLDDRKNLPASLPKTLKDLNFLDQHIRLPEGTAEAMKLQVLQDTLFLRRLGIMDYSLLVAVVRPHNSCPPHLATVVCREIEHAFLTEDVRSPPVEQQGEKRGLLKQMGAKVAALRRVFTSGRRKLSAASRRQSAQMTTARTSRFESCEGGLAGFDPSGGPDLAVYYIGIIDILTVYNWKKRAAHFFKKFTIGCCHEIDTEPPSVYQPRFIKYFDEKIQGVTSEDAQIALRLAATIRIQRFFRSRQKIQPC